MRRVARWVSVGLIVAAAACGKSQGGATADAGVDQGGISGQVTLFPAPGGQGICPDPPLRLTFTGPPTLGLLGLIQVFDASAPATPVAKVDMMAATVNESIAGKTFNLPRPVYVDGNDAIVRLRSHSLAYGKTYYVTVDAGAIMGPDGASLSVTGEAAWTFTTAAAGPADPSQLVVALDGTGSFCSVQGAIDSIPLGNMNPVTVTIKRGTYHEIIQHATRNNVTFHGEDRKGTIIAETNNNNLNPSSSGRALVGIDTSSGVVLENLTIHNLTPQGGSQAEALRIGGCDKCVVRDADILSLQDTLQWTGRVYASNLYVEGNVDFIWGSGVAYFQSCELKTVGRPGYNVQSRNPATGFGYVFVDSRLTSDPGLFGNMLARIDASMYGASHVAYINCELGSHISAAGWTVTGVTPPPDTLRFWEYGSHDPAGNPIDVSMRLAGSTQLTAEQAAMMRDPSMVLGGWMPDAAP